MNPDHTITGDWRERLEKFGYTSVIRGATPEDDERLFHELATFVNDYNIQTKKQKLDRRTLYLTPESMLFSIHPKEPKTEEEFKLERAWKQQTKK